MKKTLKESLLVFSVFLLLGVLIQKNYFEKFPRHIHGWAQCDRYALSKGFLKNNFNLFEGQTYVQNLQFPGKYEVPGETTRTAVDLPIADYIAAVFMRLSSNASPFWFRFITFVFGLFALLYFFKLCRLLGAHFQLAFFSALLFFFSPLFLYYQAALMPSVPSLCFLVIGLYHFIKCRKKVANKHLLYAIVFLTLAGLNRLTFVIPLFAIFCWEILALIQNKKLNKSHLIASGIGLLVIFGYWFHNKSVTNLYGSLFLNELLYPQSLEQALRVIVDSFKSWFFDYFSLVHYLVFATAIVLRFLFSKRIDWAGIARGRSIWSLVFIWLLGLVLFSFLMMRQFEHHDYYFLDTFFLPIVLSMVLLLIPFQNKIRKNVWWICIALFSISTFFVAQKNLEERYSESPMEINSIVYENFKNAPSLLRDLDIDTDKKILILDAYIPNMGLLLMDRNGFVVMTSSKENIENALTWNYDYVVFQNNLFFDNVYKEFPEIINRIEVIGKNAGISIAVLKEKESNVELDDFLELQEPIIEFYDDFHITQKNDFDSIETSMADSGFFVINPEMEFALTQELELEDLGDNHGGVLKIGVNFQRKKKGDCHLVVTSNEGGYFYKTKQLKFPVSKQVQELKEYYFKIPPLPPESEGLKVYLWNKGKGTYEIKEMRIELF